LQFVSTYGILLDLLGLAALECDAVALVLETLRSDETLDARSLGVWLRALLALLGLDLTTDDKLANLHYDMSVIEGLRLNRHRSRLVGEEE
jgi:hypothetical protein